MLIELGLSDLHGFIELVIRQGGIDDLVAMLD